MRSKLGWPPAPHWATTSYLALPTRASTGASEQLHLVWDSNKRKSTGSGHPLIYKRYYNLVWVRMRSNLGWSPAPHWATTSYLALPTCASTGASCPLYFVWDGSKRKSTGSDHPILLQRHYKLVCVRMRSNLGWPQAPHWATISYLALPTCASTGASEQLHLVWDISKRKSTGSEHLLI